MNFLRGLAIGIAWLVFGCISAQELDPSVPHLSMVTDVISATDLELLEAANRQLWERGRPDSSSWLLDQLATRLDTTEATATYGRYLFQRGKTSFYLQDIRLALNYFKLACSVYEELDDLADYYYAESYRQLAEMEKFIHADFGQTVADYRFAINLFELQGDTLSYLYTVQNLAQFYGKYQFYELAREERKAVFYYAKELELYEALVIAHIVQAIEYEFQGLERETLMHLRLAEEALARMPRASQLNYFTNRFNFAHYYFAEEVDCANFYFREIEEVMALFDNNERLLDHFKRDRGMWHYLNGNYTEAKNISLSLLTEAEERGEQNEVLVILKLLKKISGKQGNYKDAYRYTERELKLKDSLQQEVRLTQSVYYENLYEQEQEAFRQERQREQLAAIELRNREQVMKYVLLGIVAFLLLLSAYLYRSFRFQRDKEQLQHQFSRDLLLGRTEERKQIAMDLHDHIIHDLSFVKNNLLEKGRLTEQESVYRNLNKVLGGLRGISLQLYDPSPELLGFNLAISELVDRFNDSETIFFQVNLPDQEIELPTEAAAQLFAIVQEALRNAAQHAQAKAVRTDVTYVKETIELKIQDNGIGFSVSSGQGIGLRSMRERAAIIGANLKIASQPREGTLITITYNPVV